MNHNQFPNPRTEYGVIKRYLHVLALLQNSKDSQNWNGSTLADILSLDEPTGDLSDKTVREYISEYLEKELGIEVDRTKGGRRTQLAADIEDELLEKLASLYAGFVVHDSVRELVVKAFLKKHPLDGLWMMARLYFAALEKKRVRFNYVTNTGYKIKEADFHPYHLVMRNNNLYLFGRIHGLDKPWLVILNRVTELRITDDRYEEEPPSVDEVFKDSLGSFIGKKYSVVLRFKEAVLNPMEQFLSILEPEVSKVGDGIWEARFDVADDLYLCKQLFMYGSNAEIVSPPELREMMVSMLRESVEVYLPRTGTVHEEMPGCEKHI